MHGATIRFINMVYRYKIVTLNMDGISSPMKVRMFHNFLFRQDIDIALLQEVTNNDVSTIGGYATLVKEGLDKRGNAILLK